jgi:hypothetical protein
LESRHLVGGNQDSNGPRLARYTLDNTTRLEREDHVVNGRGSDLKELLHVSFSRRPAMQKGVGVDVGQVLRLEIRELVLGLQA